MLVIGEFWHTVWFSVAVPEVPVAPQADVDVDADTEAVAVPEQLPTVTVTE
jgi:hypothetical protein